MILLVEDDPIEVDLMRQALRWNCLSEKLVVATDGVEALEFLFGSGPTNSLPSLVLLDLKLPRLDGFSVLRRIRTDNRTSRLPVVILSSSDEPRDIALANALGANNYVRKSINYHQFVSMVGDLIKRWQLGSSLACLRDNEPSLATAST